MTYNKITSWFLAISMFMFGILKFVNPFKGWYSVQITNSGLGQLSYAMGILGEIAVGLTLFLCLINKQKIPTKAYYQLTNISFFIIIVMMLTGVYVHLHPNVHSDVLPLKIKPPYIPIFFLLIAFSNIILNIQLITHKTNKK
ncbi:hypothetical protein [Confluentibacter citreus]|uniref:hypothetical protein n=1 Tax=Confluentibacter citreus TaxID=2007307 RepID=UPI001874C2F2|nr:hypothetical protein [Confluentibacter citreus]